MVVMDSLTGFLHSRASPGPSPEFTRVDRTARRFSEVMKAPSLASMLKPSYVWNFVSATLRKFCGRDLTQLQLSARSQWNQMYIIWCAGQGIDLWSRFNAEPWHAAF